MTDIASISKLALGLVLSGDGELYRIILLSLLPLFVGWLRHRAASVGAG